MQKNNFRNKSQNKKFVKKEYLAKQKKTMLVIGNILAFLAIIFLIINSIFLELNKEKYTSDLRLNPNISLETIKAFPTLVNAIVALWVLITVIIVFSLFLLKNTSCLWIILLVLSFICLFTFRIDSFLFCILSSIFFYKSNKGI